MILLCIITTFGFHRCISAVIAASEFVRLERGEYQRQSTSNGHANEVLEPEVLNRATVEANAKSAMQLYTKCSAVISLDSWADSNRYYSLVIAKKLLFFNKSPFDKPINPNILFSTVLNVKFKSC